MNNKALKTLEYTKIIEMLAAHASSPLGKIRCEDLLPSCSPGEIEYKQEQTQDALSRLFQKGNINFGSAKDIRGSLKRLEIGSTLGITELLQICALLDNTSRVKSYGRREKENEQRDSLDDLFDALEPLPLLNTEIRRCILSEDEIADDASPGLHHVRRQMKITADKVHTQLNAILNYRGGSLEGSKLYVTLFPCNECAKAIIQAGIQTIVYESDKYANDASTRASKRMLNAAGVRYYQYNPTGRKIEYRV